LPLSETENLIVTRAFIPSIRLKGQTGFTMIEVMVGTVLSLIVVAAALAVLMVSQKTTIISGQVAAMQQSSRSALDLLTRDVKLASFSYVGNDPSASTVGTCRVINGAITIPVGLRPSDQNPAGADTGPDGISMVVPVLNDVVTPWVLSAAVGGTVPPIVPFNVVPLTATIVSDMVSQGLTAGSVISLSGADPRTVQSVGGTSITLTASYDAKFPAGSPVYLLQCVTYAVSTSAAVCGPGSSTCLTRNGVAFVDGVEDIQFSYGCDGCNANPPNPGLPDGTVDQQTGGALTATGPSSSDFVTNSAWNVIPMTPDKIKQVRLTIVARTQQSDGGFGEVNVSTVNTTGPVIISDHNPSADPGYNATTYSKLRRRVLTKIVQPRNL
jgi:type IV pilus assembly protein PilW